MPALLAAVFASSLLTAQAQPAAALPGAPAQSAVASGLPAPLVLGQRIQALRDKVTYLSTVVIVTDAASYIKAIEQWSPTSRFPVLIDDGSKRSRDDIARFVRGYAPSSVVRWEHKPTTGGASSAPGAAGFDASSVSAIQQALARVWTAGGQPAGDGAAEQLDASTLAAAWKRMDHRPPGIVVMHANDPAWAAALPLAAAWGQLLLTLDSKPGGNIDHSISIEEADGVERTVSGFAASSGYAWEEMGDAIESITLCLNIPERIKKDNEFVALSDRLGRKGAGLNMRERWAWTGHIFGTASESAYRAMSSLFLPPRRAWLFDGYPDSSPWNLYDVTKAAEYLTTAGIKCEVDDTPRQGAINWRQRAAGPVTADFIFVNTKGNNDFFDLEPGQCKPGDVPFLVRPAALHFVHSWSLLFPGKRESVGGRWLERGVFVYAGSVHEPFLQAFTPTPSVAGRLMSGAPFAPSIRVEGQPVWKIAVLGDPLYTPGPAVKRSEDGLPAAFAAAKPLAEGLKDLLANEQWDQGILTMKLLGRDADIAKLVAALAQKKGDAVTPGVLREGALAAFMAGNTSVLLMLVNLLPADAPVDPVIADCLWLTAGPLLERGPAGRSPAARADSSGAGATEAERERAEQQRADQPALLRALKNYLRADQLEQDARVLSLAWGRQFGPQAITGLFSGWREKYTSAEQRTALQKAQQP